MRLRELAELLREVLPGLTFNASQIGGNYSITNYRPATVALRRFSNAPGLQKSAKAALAVGEIADHVENRITVSHDTYQRFNTAVAQVRTKAEVLLETLDDLLEKESPEQVAIELPPGEDDLSDTAEIFVETEKLLNQVLANSFVNGEVRLVAFDRGSNWIELYLGSLAAISVVGAMVKLVYDIRVKELDIANRLEVLRSIKLETDLAAAAEKALEAELRVMTENGVTHIAQVGGIPEDNHDMRERIKFAVETLGGLISRGVRVQPSLSAPDEQKSEFPDRKLITAATKQLTAPKKQLES